MIIFALAVFASAVGLAAIVTGPDRRYVAQWGTDDPKEWHRALCACHDGRERPVCEL